MPSHHARNALLHKQKNLHLTTCTCPIASEPEDAITNCWYTPQQFKYNISKATVCIPCHRCKQQGYSQTAGAATQLTISTAVLLLPRLMHHHQQHPPYAAVISNFCTIDVLSSKSSQLATVAGSPPLIHALQQGWLPIACCYTLAPCASFCLAPEPFNRRPAK